ncbi:MAG: hypothetical protein ACPG05_00855, partial [Bdellovibrionales bacterium]
MLKNIDKRYENEHGGVLILIFITIALFAALSFAYTQMGSGGKDVMSAGQARLIATEIIDYSKDIERAVDRLIANGCSEGELDFSFDPDGDGTYREAESYPFDNMYNTNSRTDHSCHVMHPNGGKQK